MTRLDFDAILGHRRRMRRRFVLAVLAAAAPAAARAQAAGVLDLAVDYRADSVIGEGERAFPGRLWRTRRALRHESRQGGKPLIVIARLDRRTGWLALPDSGVAIETGIDALDLPVEILDGGGGLAQTRLGRERVNGLDTTKIRVERRAASGTTFDGFVWATDQGVIARLEGEGERQGKRGRTVMNFRNVVIGRLDPSHFDPPAGLQLIRVRAADLPVFLEGLEALQGATRRAR